jgi:hypothetical protein
VENKMITKIFQKGDKDHQDSFWYRDTVATVENGNKKVIVIANGDIRIEKNGEIVHDISKERNNGFGFKVENDTDLAKVNEENGFYWDMNNWFEVFEDDLGDMGEVCDTYDQAMEVAKELTK